MKKKNITTPSAGYVFAIAVYVTVTIPSLRIIVALPTEEEALVAHEMRRAQTEAMRVLAAGNTIIMLALGAILVLQVRSAPAHLTRRRSWVI